MKKSTLLSYDCVPLEVLVLVLKLVQENDFLQFQFPHLQIWPEYSDVLECCDTLIMNLVVSSDIEIDGCCIDAIKS